MFLPSDPSPFRPPPPLSAPDPVERSSRTAWAATRWGCWVLGGCGFTAHMVVGQCLPGLAVGVYLAVESGMSGGGIDEGLIQEKMSEFLPHLTILSAVFGVLTVLVIARLGLLAPKPCPRGPVGGWLVWTPLCAAACIVGQIGITAAMIVGGFEPEEQEIVVDAMKAAHPLLLFVGIAIAAPVGEELVFRRFLFSNFVRGNGRVVAYIVTALLFAAIHLNPSSFPLYLWIALWSTVAYERTGSVWAAVVVHAANNAVAILPMLV